MKESEDMPRYLHISVSKSLSAVRAHKNRDDSRLWINGKSPQKRYFPERVGGTTSP